VFNVRADLERLELIGQHAMRGELTWDFLCNKTAHIDHEAEYADSEVKRLRSLIDGNTILCRASEIFAQRSIVDANAAKRIYFLLADSKQDVFQGLTEGEVMLAFPELIPVIREKNEKAGLSGIEGVKHARHFPIDRFVDAYMQLPPLKYPLNMDVGAIISAEFIVHILQHADILHPPEWMAEADPALYFHPMSFSSIQLYDHPILDIPAELQRRLGRTPKDFFTEGYSLHKEILLKLE
jgi:hypothetical protein